MTSHSSREDLKRSSKEDVSRKSKEDVRPAHTTEHHVHEVDGGEEACTCGHEIELSAAAAGVTESQLSASDQVRGFMPCCFNGGFIVHKICCCLNFVY